MFNLFSFSFTFADTNTTITISSQIRESSSTSSFLFKRNGNCSNNRFRSKISKNCLSCARCSSGTHDCSLNELEIDKFI